MPPLSEITGIATARRTAVCIGENMKGEPDAELAGAGAGELNHSLFEPPPSRAGSLPPF